MRVGFGYDVHKLANNRKLIIGGVDIPYQKGLLGHSDADVLIHSIIDAILGATSKGDIGRLFPDTDENYKEISSIKLLEKTVEIMYNEKYIISNIDSTIVIQKPKISQYIEQMRRNISHILNINIENISIKATTTEGLGFVGIGQGVAAYAVVLIE